MKKIVITICAIGLAAVAAQAQGVARDVNAFGKEYLAQKDTRPARQTAASKTTARQVDSLTKAVQTQVVKKYRQMYVMGALGDTERYAASYAADTQKDEQVGEKTGADIQTCSQDKSCSEENAVTKNQAAKEKKTDGAYPSYLCGREGHMMALGEAVSRHAGSRGGEAGRSQTPKKAETKRQKKEGSLLKAIFLGGRFPGESEEYYKIRQQVASSPAGQPFK